jgi:hypothetical protein
MSGATKLSRLIDRVHGRMFAHALAQALEVPPRWYFLAQAERHHLSRQFIRQANRKYRAGLQGALLHRDTRKGWCVVRPELLVVERNPLWEVLKVQPWQKFDWDERAATISVNNQSIIAYDVARHLWAYPSWTRLASLLVLLHTCRPCYFQHRHAVRAVLVPYVALACLEPIVLPAARDLFEVLTFHVVQKSLTGGALAHWPADFIEFSEIMNVLQSGIEEVGQREKRIAQPSNLPALFWTLLLQPSEKFKWEDARKRPVRERWMSAVNGFRQDVITFPGGFLDS